MEEREKYLCPHNKYLKMLFLFKGNNLEINYDLADTFSHLETDI